MLSDLGDLKERIAAVARDSAVGPRVADVTLEPAQDDYGSSFLRVVVQLNGLERQDDEALKALLKHIEDEVAELDERYPGVRFSEPA
jgi:hypothetical protein